MVVKYFNLDEFSGACKCFLCSGNNLGTFEACGLFLPRAVLINPADVNSIATLCMVHSLADAL